VIFVAMWTWEYDNNTQPSNVLMFGSWDNMVNAKEMKKDHNGLFIYKEFVEPGRYKVMFVVDGFVCRNNVFEKNNNHATADAQYRPVYTVDVQHTMPEANSASLSTTSQYPAVPSSSSPSQSPSAHGSEVGLELRAWFARIIRACIGEKAANFGFNEDLYNKVAAEIDTSTLASFSLILAGLQQHGDNSMRLFQYQQGVTKAMCYRCRTPGPQATSTEEFYYFELENNISQKSIDMALHSLSDCVACGCSQEAKTAYQYVSKRWQEYPLFIFVICKDWLSGPYNIVNPLDKILLPNGSTYRLHSFLVLNPKGHFHMVFFYTQRQVNSADSSSTPGVLAVYQRVDN
jgi:hypothetical protein